MSFYTLSHCTLTQTICYRAEHFLWYHLKFPFNQRETICTDFTANQMYHTNLLNGIRNWDDVKGIRISKNWWNWVNTLGHWKYNPTTDAETTIYLKNFGHTTYQNIYAFVAIDVCFMMCRRRKYVFNNKNYWVWIKCNCLV